MSENQPLTPEQIEKMQDRFLIADANLNEKAHDAGFRAMNSAILINGGAAITTVIVFSTSAKIQPGTIAPFVTALLLFGLGVLSGSMAIGYSCLYYSKTQKRNYELIEKFGIIEFIRNGSKLPSKIHAWFNCSIIFTIFAFLYFLVGGFFVIRGLTGLYFRPII